jgi:hypothetical protein
VSQRIFGIALGYEDLNDHDELRHDPVMATLVGKLEAGRADCAPLAGKSTLKWIKGPSRGSSNSTPAALAGGSRRSMTVCAILCSIRSMTHRMKMRGQPDWQIA